MQPPGFGVTISDNVPLDYGLTQSDFDGVYAVWNASMGQATQACKLFNNGGVFPTTISSSKWKAAVAQGARIWMCYKPDPALSSTDRTNLVASLNALTAAGMNITGVILYQEANRGTGITDTPVTAAQYVAAVNYYGPNIVSAGFALGHNSAGSGSGQWYNYFSADKGFTAAVSFIGCDYYGQTWLKASQGAAGFRLLDQAGDVNNINTIAAGYSPPLAVGILEMGTSSDGTVNPPTQANTTSYVHYLRDFLKTRRAGGLSNVDSLWFDGQHLQPNVIVSSGDFRWPLLQDFAQQTTGTSSAFTPVQTAANVAGSAGSLALTLTSASTAGTLLAARIMGNDCAATVTPPANWVLISDIKSGTTTTQARVLMYYYSTVTGQGGNPGGITGATWTYTGTGTIKGRLSEWSTPAGTAQYLDQVSAGVSALTASTSMAAPAAGSNTLAGDLGMAVFGAWFSTAPSGQTWPTPSGWTGGNSINNVQAVYNCIEADSLPAGATSVTQTISTSTNMTSYAGALCTFYSQAVSGAAIQITTVPPLPVAKNDGATSYSVTFTVTGNIGAVTWALTTGTLPAGFTLSAAGVLSGTTTDLAGTYGFTVRVTDSTGAAAGADFTIAVVAAPPAVPGPPAFPQAGYPQVIIEAGFYAAAPVAFPGAFILDDPVNGKLGTGMLGDATAWTDITTYLRSGTVTRASTRVQGPLRTYQAGTASAVLDNATGAFDPDNAGGPFVSGGVPLLRPMLPLRVRAVFGSLEYHLFSGFADAWTETPVDYDAGWSEVTVTATDGFKILTGITLPPVAATGDGEQSGTRIARILAAAQWYTDHQHVGAGNSPVQATTYGDTALALLQLTADTEIGELYVDGSGNVVFRSRNAALSEARSITPQAVFGDLPGTADPEGTELACAAVGRADDDTALANDVQVTAANFGTLQRAKNTASVNKYLFPRSYSRTDVLLESDTEALGYAQWVLYLSLTGQDRFDTLTIDPVADPYGLFPQVLGREIGDRIMVYRRPQNSATTIARPCFIRGITHNLDVTAGTWQTVWDLDDATRYTGFLILNDATLGKVSSGNKLAY